MCAGHLSPGAAGMWGDGQASEGGSLRWVVAAGGGDSSREEGHRDTHGRKNAAQELSHRERSPGAVPQTLWVEQEGPGLSGVDVTAGTVGNSSGNQLNLFLAGHP